MNTFPPKDFQEKITITFDFTEDIVMESISNASISIDTFTGFDNSPGLVLVGPAVISDAIISQEIQGGTPYCIYRVRCTVTTNNGRILVVSSYLPISGYDSLYGENFETNSPA